MDKLGIFLVKQNIIKEDDREICDYGLFVILFNGLTMITTLILGTWLISWHFALYFLLFFLPIRMLFGGGHCQTPQKCFVFTHIDLVVVFIIAIFLPSLVLNSLSILFISIAMMIYLLSDKRKIFKMILLLFFILDMFIFFNFIQLRLSLSCAYLLSSYLYLSDKIKVLLANVKKLSKSII